MGIPGRWGPRWDGDPAWAACGQAAGSLPSPCVPGEEAAVIALGDSGGFSFFFQFNFFFFFCSSPPYFPSFYKKHLTAGSWLQPTRSPAPSRALAPHGTQGWLGPPQHPITSWPGRGGCVLTSPRVRPPPVWGAAAITHGGAGSWHSQDCHLAQGSQRRAAWSPPPLSPHGWALRTPASPPGRIQPSISLRPVGIQPMEPRWGGPYLCQPVGNRGLPRTVLRVPAPAPPPARSWPGATSKHPPDAWEEPDYWGGRAAGGSRSGTLPSPPAPATAQLPHPHRASVSPWMQLRGPSGPR